MQLDGNTPNFDTSKYRSKGKINPATPEEKAQDLHKQLKVILNSYQDMEKAGGLDWDMPWDGVVGQYRLVPFIVFARVDGKEGDKFCGQYLTKNSNIRSLCRICVCPTMSSDDTTRNDERKTVGMIQKLVRLGKTSDLQKISQHCIFNAFYELRFGCHDDTGIHGATPPDKLHYMNIGQFGYSRECLFQQLGETGQLSEGLSNIATLVGVFLQRQSDRDLPRTSFANGVQGGRMTGEEMTGVILVLSGALRTTRGRQMILNKAIGKQKANFPNETAIAKWIALLETQLQYEAWLSLDEMSVSVVKGSDPKLRQYMDMTKEVQNRQSGMKHNTLNHHLTMHMRDAVVNFGVPGEFDTFNNERHHRDDKATSRMTQRRPDKFNTQLARKKRHKMAVKLGLEELQGRKRWHYYLRGGNHSNRESLQKAVDPFQPVLTGVKVQLVKQEGHNNYQWINHSKMKGVNQYKHDIATKDTLQEVLNWCSEHIHQVMIYDCLKLYDPRADNNTRIYRASPLYEGKPWYDWAIFDLRGEGETGDLNAFVPAQIKCFLELTGLPEDVDFEYPNGVYAIIEPTVPNPDVIEHALAELWEPYLKLPSPIREVEHTQNKTCIAHLESLIAPAIVIPDIDNPNKRAYLRLASRSTWATRFNDWLASPH